MAAEGLDGRSFAADSPPWCRRFAAPPFCYDSAAQLLLPARNKQILPSLPLIRLHQE
jgi:hypothetical protein